MIGTHPLKVYAKLWECIEFKKYIDQPQKYKLLAKQDGCPCTKYITKYQMFRM